MSNRNIYEVRAAEDFTFKTLETVRVKTDLIIEPSDSELYFFKIDTKLYSAHGIVCLEPCLFCDEKETVNLNLVKICPPSLATIGVKTFYENTFGENTNFKIQAGDFLGRVFLVNIL